MSCETYCKFNPFIDTEFSESFNMDNLNEIKTGMAKEEVTELLGDPLFKNTYKSGTERYSYTCSAHAELAYLKGV
jgi:outer membrane protein assembly factor BamE (lipoprotein component of BamABCDE complex)